MTRGLAVDVNAFHAILWEEKDRLGRVKLVQSERAVALGVTKFTMSRIVAKMVQDGRIRQISRKKHLMGHFVVMDPADWRGLP